MPSKLYPLRLTPNQRDAIATARDKMGLTTDAELINAAIAAYLKSLEIHYPASRSKGDNKGKVK